jgi:hypothetical protein
MIPFTAVNLQGMWITPLLIAVCLGFSGVAMGAALSALHSIGRLDGGGVAARCANDASLA